MKVAVLGASNKPERFSYKTLKMLVEKGHSPFPVHPAHKEIDGIPVYKSLEDLPEKMDTISVYLSAANSEPLTDSLLRSGARRVIFNPGAENPVLAGKLRAVGIEALEACSFLLLTADRL